MLPDIVHEAAPARAEPTSQLVPDFLCWVYDASRPVLSMVSEPSRDEIGNFRTFRNPKHGVVDSNHVYDASAGLVAEFGEPNDGRRLVCKGIVLDVIDGLGPVREYRPDGRLHEYSSSTLVQSTSDVNTTEFRDPGYVPRQSAGSGKASMTLWNSWSAACRSTARRYLMWPAPVEGDVSQLRERHLDPVP